RRGRRLLVLGGGRRRRARRAGRRRGGRRGGTGRRGRRGGGGGAGGVDRLLVTRAEGHVDRPQLRSSEHQAVLAGGGEFAEEVAPVLRRHGLAARVELAQVPLAGVDTGTAGGGAGHRSRQALECGVDGDGLAHGQRHPQGLGDEPLLGEG